MIVQKDLSSEHEEKSMGRFFVNLLKLIFIIILLGLLGLAIYTLFFDPKTETHEITEELELSQ